MKYQHGGKIVTCILFLGSMKGLLRAWITYQIKLFYVPVNGSLSGHGPLLPQVVILVDGSSSCHGPLPVVIVVHAREPLLPVVIVVHAREQGHANISHGHETFTVGSKTVEKIII